MLDSLKQQTEAARPEKIRVTNQMLSSPCSWSWSALGLHRVSQWCWYLGVVADGQAVGGDVGVDKVLHLVVPGRDDLRPRVHFGRVEEVFPQDVSCTQSSD